MESHRAIIDRGAALNACQALIELGVEFNCSPINIEECEITISAATKNALQGIIERIYRQH